MLWQAYPVTRCKKASLCAFVHGIRIDRKVNLVDARYSIHSDSASCSQGGVDFNDNFLYFIWRRYLSAISVKTSDHIFMSNTSSLELQLASLLCPRLCHDLAGPFGAVNNGAELLNDDGEDSVDMARDLITDCAGQAVRRVRFCRLAYGSDHGSMDWAGAMQISEAMLVDSKVTYTWQGHYDGAEGPEVAAAGKLALNMVMLGANFLPRGGTMEFIAADDVQQPHITVRGEGPLLILDEAALDALANGCRRDGEVLKELNARYVQPYLTGLLAANLNHAAELSGKHFGGGVC